MNFAKEVNLSKFSSVDNDSYLFNVAKKVQFSNLITTISQTEVSRNYLYLFAAFHKAGCLDEASKVLQILTKNAVNESRFQDAGYYYWVLSKQCLDIAVQNKDDESKMVELYHKNDKLASIYYAYHIIQRYMDEPFTSFTSESLFNIARYLVNETKSVKPQEVSQFAILYTLSKQAQSLGAYKLARQVLDRMQTLRIPPQFRVSFRRCRKEVSIKQETRM